jgi:hypothetical protein
VGRGEFDRDELVSPEESEDVSVEGSRAEIAAVSGVGLPCGQDLIEE